MTDLITTPVTADLLRGCVETEQTADGLLPHRLPAWVRTQIPEPQLLMVESQPSGVRLAFRTSATRIELDTMPTKRAYAGNPPMPDGVYDLVVDGRLVDQGSVDGGKTRTVDMMTGTSETTPGPGGTLRFAGLESGPKDVEIWLPYDETTELVSLRTDAPVEPAAPSGRRTWVHHGSSISHGSVAASPSQTWPARAAGLAGVDLVNFGFGGSALLDPAVARVLRDTPADVISVKIGINLVNTDLMRLRAFGPAVHGLLDTIREGHPTAPLLVVSPILCPIQEETPGPLLPDLSGDSIAFVAAGDPEEVASGKLTLRVIRTELARIVLQRRSDDPHLHLLDGRELYGEDDAAELPLPDRVHPDAATHRLMGDRFAEAAFLREGAPLAAGR
ncbi:SGNH/GDSL hydrolase family protein [Nocardioides gilvus]|uniref:SGNH/GDSL hydrolase family protein n=1 Tax=Nocardioides gilvus TaxID=1735589 RepID=UPI000D74225D|nr:SGNH/GDSL hydrolase family protein [Nocardioides gilvus]